MGDTRSSDETPGRSVERSRRIKGRKFIIPIVAVHEYDGDAGRFRLMPTSFLGTHFCHAPEGSLSADLLNEITRLIPERRSQRPT